MPAPTSTRSGACSTRRSRATSRIRARRVAAKMFAHLDSPPPAGHEPRGPDAPAELDDVVVRALAKDPDERFASAGELARAALAAVEQPSRIFVGPEAAPRSRARRRVARIRRAAAVAAGRRVRAGRVRRARGPARRGWSSGVRGGGRPAPARAARRRARDRQDAAGGEFARRAVADWATVLYGRSDPESLVPYQPFITAVQHLIAHRPTLGRAGRAQARAQRAGALRPGAAPPRRLPRAARRTSPTTATGSSRRSPACWPSPRASTRRARPRRPAMGRHLDGADARPHAARRRVRRTRSCWPRMRDVTEEGCAGAQGAARAHARQRGFERIALTGLDGEETQALLAAHEEARSASSFVQPAARSDRRQPAVHSRDAAEPDGGAAGRPQRLQLEEALSASRFPRASST